MWMDVEGALGEVGAAKHGRCWSVGPDARNAALADGGLVEDVAGRVDATAGAESWEEV